MKYLAVLVLVAVWMRGSEAARCEDVISCTPDTSMMQSGSAADIAAVCRSVQTAISCFREAMQDCRSTGSIPESTIRNLETQIDKYDAMLAGHCSSSSSSSSSSSNSNANSNSRNEYSSSDRGQSGSVSDVRPSVIVVFVITVIALLTAAV
ncbi:uncharacterized protein LOC143301643 [Babylonia areolata]|uniref:uncharacterized protein LOC143301643 n=1 Tax=Babylonia areolata TaxID=304850 RepID=UPI003FD31509